MQKNRNVYPIVIPESIAYLRRLNTREVSKWPELLAIWVSQPLSHSVEL